MEAFRGMFSKDTNSSRSKKKGDVRRIGLCTSSAHPSSSSARPPSLKARFVDHIKIQPLTLTLPRVVRAPSQPLTLTALLSFAYPVEGGPASVHFRNLRRALSDNINSMDVNLGQLSAPLRYMEACLSRFWGTLDPFIGAHYGNPIAIGDFHRLIDGVRDDVINITESATRVAMSRGIGGMCMPSYELDRSIQMCLSEASNKIKQGETLVNRFLAPFSGVDQYCYYEFLDHFDELARVIQRETIILDQHVFPSA